MMQEHLNQARYNEQFMQALDIAFPDDYYDWRVTLVFYTALHYLQATASHHGKFIGKIHKDIKENIKRGGVMPLRKPWAIDCYETLEDYSRKARYSGFSDIEVFQRTQKKNYEMALQDLQSFKNFLRDEMSLPIE